MSATAPCNTTSLFDSFESIVPVQNTLNLVFKVLLHKESLRILLLLPLGIVLIVQKMIIRLLANVHLHREIRSHHSLDVVLDGIVF